MVHSNSTPQATSSDRPRRTVTITASISSSSSFTSSFISSSVSPRLWRLWRCQWFTLLRSLCLGLPILSWEHGGSNITLYERLQGSYRQPKQMFSHIVESSNPSKHQKGRFKGRSVFVSEWHFLESEHLSLHTSCISRPQRPKGTKDEVSARV